MHKAIMKICALLDILLYVKRPKRLVGKCCGKRQMLFKREVPEVGPGMRFISLNNPIVSKYISIFLPSPSSKPKEMQNKQKIPENIVDVSHVDIARKQV